MIAETRSPARGRALCGVSARSKAPTRRVIDRVHRTSGRTRWRSRRKGANPLASRRYLLTEVKPQNDREDSTWRSTEAERQCLTETQSLTRDEAGREVLVGLTYEESNLLMVYR